MDVRLINALMASFSVSEASSARASSLQTPMRLIQRPSRLPTIFEDEEEILHHDLTQMATRDSAARHIVDDYQHLKRFTARNLEQYRPNQDEVKQFERDFVHNEWIRALYIMGYVWRHHQQRVDDEDRRRVTPRSGEQGMVSSLTEYYSQGRKEIIRHRKNLGVAVQSTESHDKGRKVLSDMTNLLQSTSLNIRDRTTRIDRVEIIPAGISHNDKENTHPRRHTLDNLFYNILPPMTYLEVQADEGAVNLDQSNVVLDNEREGGIVTATRREFWGDLERGGVQGRFRRSYRPMGLGDLFDTERGEDGVRRWTMREEEYVFRMAM
ncbi:MAG: hypothetical protein L6R38_005268 [Xanthoria sp. 2 TBL-2021]|nr:MAG: hypothetical protein L6R38_005268 [Xanthoria sp. 2 TBL-2021]